MDAELPVLSGWINVPTQSGFSLNRISKKKASQRYCLLFKASRQGIERLEICESKDDKNPKIITLENCVKITHEPAPANLIQIVTKTVTLTLNALSDEDLKEWVNSLQMVAFRDKSMLHISNVVIEEDNDLYCSSFADGLFIVTLIPSETSIRCNIEPKAYMLQLTTTELQLKSTDDPNVIVATWPYRFIRKYGYRDGKFTFEAGRKCSTGEGVFTLDHTNPQEVFRCMSAKMKSMKKLITGESLNVIECGENVLSVAAGMMEAGSRSPLPPSPSTQKTSDFEMNSTQSGFSLRGFISSSDSLNNISINASGNSARPPAKHVPSKPPRKLPSTESGAGAHQSTAAQACGALETEPNCDKFKKLSNYDPVTITSSANPNKTVGSTVILKPSNAPAQGLPPPVLPLRNESFKTAMERDYESIETITDAWKTLGVSEVKHTERIVPQNSNNDELMRQRALMQRDKLKESQLPVVKKIIDIDIGESAAIAGANNNSDGDDATYDRLNFLAPNNNSSSGYKTIVAVTSPVSHRLRCSPPPPNDYELIASPDIQSCRKADDSHMGYGRILRKSSAGLVPSPHSTTSSCSNPNNAISIPSYAEQQQQQQPSAQSGTESNAPPLDHRSYNGLNYTIVSKPKRV